MVAAIWVAGAAGAPAGQPPVSSDPVTEATARAAAFWGGVPCRGEVSVLAGINAEAPPAGANAPQAPSAIGARAAMWATWSSPVGANEFAAPPVTFTACVVHVNVSVWPGWEADDRGFTAFCKEMVHEYGHFEGHSDVGQRPGTVEYEQPDLARVPSCESYRLVYGHHLYLPAPSRPRGRHTRRLARHVTTVALGRGAVAEPPGSP
jgi:hypothetical protein